VNIIPSSVAGYVVKNPNKLTYVYGDQVTLTASPSSGYTFSSWSGVDSSNGATAYITMNGNRMVTANFIQPVGPDLTGLWTKPVSQTCKITHNGEMWWKKCTIKGTFTIINIGNRDARYAYVTFYLSDNDTYDGGDKELKRVSTGIIKAGNDKDIKLSYNFLMGDSTLRKYIIAVIKGPHSETKLDNNIIPFGPIP
jgi:hypothetical protein